MICFPFYERQGKKKEDNQRGNNGDTENGMKVELKLLAPGKSGRQKGYFFQ